MTLDGLRALLEVVRAGSINQAAVSLGVPRTTLTRRIDALEGWFGTSLISTSRDGATPTAAGERLVAGAEALLRQASALDGSVRLGLELPTRPVRVAVSPGFHPMPLSMALQQLQERLPGVQLHIRVQADPFHREATDYPDFIVSFGRPLIGDYRVFRLIGLRYALLASPEYLARCGAPASIEALDGHTLWAWEHALEPRGRGLALRLRDGQLRSVQPALVHNDLHQLHVALQRGLCLALVPSSPFEVFEPNEVEVLKGTLGGETGLWVAVPERNADLPWTRRLVSELRQLVALFEGVQAEQSAVQEG